MRSNNATTLLPYNIFEFSLLAELKVAELRSTGGLDWLELGPMTYTAVSMHIYEEHLARASEIVAMGETATTYEVPPIPSSAGAYGSPLEQVRRLVRLEPKLRQSARGLSEETFEAWREEAENELDSYWRQYFYLLLYSIATQYRFTFALHRLEGLLESPWRDYLGPAAFRLDGSVASSYRNLLGEEVGVIAMPDSGQESLHSGTILKLAEVRSKERLKKGLPPISVLELRSISDKLGGRDTGIAARPKVVSPEEFEIAFLLVRRVHIQEPLL